MEEGGMEGRGKDDKRGGGWKGVVLLFSSCRACCASVPAG